MQFTVFGLGDTGYEKYNAVAILVDKALEELGAQRFYPLGKSDEQIGIDTCLEKWKEQGLWPKLCNSFYT